MVQVVLPASPDMKIIHLSYTHQNKALHSMYYVAVVQTQLIIICHRKMTNVIVFYYNNGVCNFPLYWPMEI